MANSSLLLPRKIYGCVHAAASPFWKGIFSDCERQLQHLGVKKESGYNFSGSSRQPVFSTHIPLGAAR